MSHSASNDSSTDAKKRYACKECDKAFSTSSHLGRHCRVHTGVKDYKCDFPGCETRCSRPDNLQAHKRVHFSSQPRTKGKKPRGKHSTASSDSHLSPGSSTSSSSPTDHAHQPSSPEMYRTPASRFSSVSASSSPQPFMSPPLPPIRGGTPGGSPFPLYVEDRFNNFPLPSSPSSHSRAGMSSLRMPYPPRFTNTMPPPIVRGAPDESLDAFNSSMLLQNVPPLQRRSNLYQPYTSSSSRAPTPSQYPYATYPHQTPVSGLQYSSSSVPSSNAPSPRASHTSSPEFPDLQQLPPY